MKKKQEKIQKRLERRDKILFFIKWFMLGAIFGGIVLSLTNCGSVSASKSTETTEPVDETTEPAKTDEHTTVDATWHVSTKTHDDLNGNSVLTFEGKLIWNFSDCTAVGKSVSEDIVTATEADYGFVIKVLDDNTVMVDPYDNSDTGIQDLQVLVSATRKT